jgi:hypothetical protein
VFSLPEPSKLKGEILPPSGDIKENVFLVEGGIFRGTRADSENKLVLPHCNELNVPFRLNAETSSADGGITKGTTVDNDNNSVLFLSFNEILKGSSFKSNGEQAPGDKSSSFLNELVLEWVVVIKRSSAEGGITNGTTVDNDNNSALFLSLNEIFRGSSFKSNGEQTTPGDKLLSFLNELVLEWVATGRSSADGGIIKGIIVDNDNNSVLFLFKSNGEQTTPGDKSSSFLNKLLPEWVAPGRSSADGGIFKAKSEGALMGGGVKVLLGLGSVMRDDEDEEEEEEEEEGKEEEGEEEGKEEEGEEEKEGDDNGREKEGDDNGREEEEKEEEEEEEGGNDDGSDEDKFNAKFRCEF